MSPRELAKGNTYRSLVQGAARRDQMWLSARSLEVELPVSLSMMPTSQHEYLSRIVVGSIVSEDIGGHAAQALLALDVEPGLRAALVRATWDEVRHSEAFAGLARALGVPTEPPNPRAYDLLDQLRSQREDHVAFLVLHVELEALALDVFRLIARHVTSAPIARLYASVAADEASHVQLGRAMLRSPAVVPEEVDVPAVLEAHHSARHLSPAVDRAAASELADAFSIDRQQVWRHLDGGARARAGHVARLLGGSRQPS